MSPLQQVDDTGDTTGEDLADQAAEAASAVITGLVAQTRAVGALRNPFGWAVAIHRELNGNISAWLASSEGPSYIPLGVRIPDDVRLAVTDAVIGRQLWSESLAGADPLELLARHARLCSAAGEPVQVLALASSLLPATRVDDWANEIGAKRAVHVDPRLVEPATTTAGQHRCAAAMPWEYGQAQAFTQAQRRSVAAHYARAAAEAGHLATRACTRVIDLFDRAKPITATDWADVAAEAATASTNYGLAAQGVELPTGPANPEWAFRTACAAEVITCLRNYNTADGCADLLYATRLAGAPLSPATGVT